MKIDVFIQKTQWILLLIIIVLGFVVRLYRFSGPIADWHSWRQADTSAVSRNFVTQGFDLLHPRFDDLSNVPSGIHDNPNGYRFVEFPFYNILQAGGFLLFHHFTLEEWGRIVTIISTLISSFLIFLLTKRYTNVTSGLLAAFFYTFFPFTIYYGRTVLPDQTMVTATLAGIYFFDLWISFEGSKVKKSILYVFTTILLAVALLFKPFAGFFFLPILWMSWKKWNWKFVLRIELWLMLIFLLTPFILWRIWMSAYPEGIPQSSWLFNAGNIRFKGAFFQWLFARRIAQLILGYWGVAILVIGIIVQQKNKLLFYSFITSSLIYLSVVARGNVQHGYYQLPIVPSLAIIMGIGADFLIHPPKQYISRLASMSMLVICSLFMFAFSWFLARDFFNINNPAIITAGAAVDQLTPKNAKVLAPYDGDTTFLYQTKRKGWASFEKPLPELIKMGADYLVLVSPKPQDFDIGKTYKIVSATKDYVLFDLHKHP